MSWNNSDGKTVTKQIKSTKAPSLLKGLIAAIVVVVAGGIAIFSLLCKSSAPAKVEEESEDKLIEDIGTTNTIEEVKEDAGKEAPTEPPKVKFEKKPGQMQLPNGKVLTFPPPKEGETRTIYANGHTYVCDHLGNVIETTKRKLLPTAFERNFMNLAQEGKPYISATMLGLDEAEVKRMLKQGYTMKGDETEEEKAALKAYDELRNAALVYMDQGGKFDDFINEYVTYDRNQRQARAITLQEVMKLYKEGNVVEAKKTADAANTVLSEKGFRPLTLPQHVVNEFSKIVE